MPQGACCGLRADDPSPLPGSCWVFLFPLMPCALLLAAGPMTACTWQDMDPLPASMTPVQLMDAAQHSILQVAAAGDRACGVLGTCACGAWWPTHQGLADGPVVLASPFPLSHPPL
jgi:hypothetical protein